VERRQHPPGGRKYKIFYKLFLPPLLIFEIMIEEEFFL